MIPAAQTNTNNPHVTFDIEVAPPAHRLQSKTLANAAYGLAIAGICCAAVGATLASISIPKHQSAKRNLGAADHSLALATQHLNTMLDACIRAGAKYIKARYCVAPENQPYFDRASHCPTVADVFAGTIDGLGPKFHCRVDLFPEIEDYYSDQYKDVTAQFSDIKIAKQEIALAQKKVAQAAANSNLSIVRPAISAALLGTGAALMVGADLLYWASRKTARSEQAAPNPQNEPAV